MLHGQRDVYMADIFISYSREDIWAMRAVRAELKRAWFSTWSDENIESGSPQWHQIIGNKIEECSCVVILVTKNTKVSEWIPSEVEHGRAHKKRILPILINGSNEDIPVYLRTYQYIDEPDDFEKGIRLLINALHRALPPEKRLQLNRVGSLYWLGVDMGQLSVLAPSLDGAKLKRYVRQVHHHANRLGIPLEVQGKLSILCDAASRFSELDWTPEKRRELRKEIQRLIDDVAKLVTSNENNWNENALDPDVRDELL